MRLLTNLKIDYQRLMFRIKRKLELNKLERLKRKAVKEANSLKNVTGKQHKVLLIEGQYVVRSRKDLININKIFSRQAKINTVELDKLTVYTTK